MSYGRGQMRLGTTLYFGDLTPDVTEEDLEELVEEVAQLDSLHIARHPQSSGLFHAFVNFYNEKSARAVMNALDGVEVKSCHLRISPKKSNPSQRTSGNNNVIVKNLDKSLTGRDLRRVFGRYGCVFSCKVEYDDYGQSKGFGYVNFETEEGAREAVAQANGGCWYEKKLQVEFHLTKRERTEVKKSEPFTNVHVKNLPKEYTAEKLSNLFSSFVDPRRIFRAAVELVERKGTCQGFVNFTDPEYAKMAVRNLNGQVIEGYEISVGRFQKREERKAELAEKGETKTNLYIKHLPECMDDANLERMFGKFGEIVSAKMQIKRGRTTGVGYVNFVDPDDAATAIQKMNAFVVDDKALFVDYHQPAERRQAELRVKYSQHRVCQVPRGRASGPVYSQGAERTARRESQEFKIKNYGSVIVQQSSDSARARAYSKQQKITYST